MLLDRRGQSHHLPEYLLLRTGELGQPLSLRRRADVDLGVTTHSPLEDDRGVDRQGIRELLALTPSERVERLVEVVATWSEILDHSRRRTTS